MTILIDAKYIGSALRAARRNIYCTDTDTANLMRISPEQLNQYELGIDVLPRHQLQQIMAMGLLMMRARHIQKDFTALSRRLMNPAKPKDENWQNAVSTTNSKSQPRGQ